jgi:hypothetical protein
MRTALLLLAMIAFPAFAAQTVWKWVDDMGVTHYSDRPVPGATKMELKVGSPSSDSAPPAASPSSNRAQPDTASGPPYQNLQITRPSAGETIVNTGGAVQIGIAIEPALHSGHTLSLYMDGQRVEGAGNSTEYSLTEVPRGVHSVTAVVSDRRGQRVQESPPVSFTVRQTSIANPPVGPALRPPPKPRPGGAANKLPTQQPSFDALNGARARIDPATNQPVKAAPKPMPRPREP